MVIYCKICNIPLEVEDTMKPPFEVSCPECKHEFTVDVAGARLGGS